MIVSPVALPSSTRSQPSDKRGCIEYMAVLAALHFVLLRQAEEVNCCLLVVVMAVRIPWVCAQLIQPLELLLAIIECLGSQGGLILSKDNKNLLVFALSDTGGATTKGAKVDALLHFTKGGLECVDVHLDHFMLDTFLVNFVIEVQPPTEELGNFIGGLLAVVVHGGLCFGTTSGTIHT